LLIAADGSIKNNLICGLTINNVKSEEKLFYSASISTALIPYIGYKKASELANLMKEKHLNIYQANRKLKIIDDVKLSVLLKTENLLKEGFTIGDLLLWQKKLTRT